MSKRLGGKSSSHPWLNEKLVGIGFLCCAVSAWAVPANPEGSVITQPDGTKFTAYLHGDEYFHWNETADGYLVVQAAPKKHWVYASQTSGKTTATDFVMGKHDPKVAGLSKVNRALLAQEAKAARDVRTALTSQTALTPRTGTMRNLVVLVNFADKTMDYPNASYDSLFNQIGYTTDGAVGSVKDFYREISYNALTVQSTIAGPVTVSQGYAYYGGNDSYGDDLHPREMVQEALALLEASGFDFSSMDGDGDGEVDGLDIIHAGGGEEYSGNDANYIWSHAWSLSSAVTYDGVRLQKYHTEPARRGWDSSPSTQGITRIGVICHETGHFLGLPDLYDYGYDSEGAGDFCLMAGGSWNGNYGTSPAHMSAWCKSFLGWLTPTSIYGSGAFSLPRVETNQSVYKLQGPFPSTQYFLVENRQGTGFDAGLPGSNRGILIWHVDETQSNNNDQTHYKVDLEEASGTQHLESSSYKNTGDDSDYYRASPSGTQTSFTNATTPNNLSYSSVPLNLNITGIGATGATMMFTVTAGYTPVTVTAVTPSSSDNSSAVSLTIAGSGFVSGASVKLTKAGEADIIGSPNPATFDSSAQLRCTVNLSGKAHGLWNVVVTNPDNQTATLANGFTLMVTYLAETFESAFVSGAPPNWTHTHQTSTIDWIQYSGDHLASGAHGGSYNALLYYQGTGNHETYLITPQINFPAGVANASLGFWHRQAVWSPDQDTLAVYYRTSGGGSWVLLASYTSSITTWNKETLSLPNLTSTYQIGFLGNAKYGYGVALDDVVVWSIPTELRGTAVLANYPPGPLGQSMQIKLRKQGGSTVSYTRTLAVDGTWLVDNITTGTYDVWMKPSHWLGRLQSGVSVTAVGTNSMAPVTFANGDSGGDNEINSTDMAIILAALGSTPSSPNWNPAADLNGDNTVNAADLSIITPVMDVPGDAGL